MTESARNEFEQLYRSSFERTCRYAGKALGDPGDGEEAASRAFVQLWDVLCREPVADMTALLHLILQRRIVDVIRERQEKPLPLGLNPLSEDGTKSEPVWPIIPPATFEDVEFHQGLDAALRALPAEDRDAFIVTELRGLTVREGASVLQTSKSDVARKAEAARTFIREEIA